MLLTTHLPLQCTCRLSTRPDLAVVITRRLRRQPLHEQLWLRQLLQGAATGAPQTHGPTGARGRRQRRRGRGAGGGALQAARPRGAPSQQHARLRGALAGRCSAAQAVWPGHCTTAALKLSPSSHVVCAYILV